MKTPKFWYQNKSILQNFLYPISIIYQFFSKLNYYFIKKKSVNIPVICVGNIVSGGSGKTPTALALYDLIKNNKKVFFLSRGYGGKFEGPLKVSLEEHYYTDVGDEPLILASKGSILFFNIKIFNKFFCFYVFS